MTSYEIQNERNCLKTIKDFLSYLLSFCNYVSSSPSKKLMIHYGIRHYVIKPFKERDT